MSVSLLALPLLAVATPQAQAAAPCPVETVDAAATAATPATMPAQPPVASPETAVPDSSTPPAPGTTVAASQPAPGAPVPAQDGQAGGNVIIVSKRAPSEADPAEAINVETFKVVTAVDQAIIEPVAEGYMDFVPKPVRNGLHNVLDNLDEPIVFINFLLQLKPGKAAETLGRFVINSTLGLGGLIDVAKKKPFNLPRRSNGLADTLGYYGVGPGPYLFLPLIGATTLRDLLARPFDLAVLPAIFPKPFAKPAVALGKGVLSSLDERAQNDHMIKTTRATSDPYATMRDYYLRRRQAEIDVLKGKRKDANVPILTGKYADELATPHAVTPVTPVAPTAPATPCQPVAPAPQSLAP